APAATAPVLACDLRDGVPAPRALPEVVHRGGVDLSPIDPADPASRAWLHSLIWPGQQTERGPRLDAALDIAAADPPQILAGDLVERVADAVAACPAGSTPVVFHTAVLGYLEPPQRAEVVRRVTELGRAAGPVRPPRRRAGPRRRRRVDLGRGHHAAAARRRAGPGRGPQTQGELRGLRGGPAAGHRARSRRLGARARPRLTRPAPPAPPAPGRLCTLAVDTSPLRVRTVDHDSAQ